ncbi:interferon alpha/beta receptor 1 isoform X1 [Xenopus tropicalis]|uniref:Tissue factor n=2 Tax=Xenopus tropicalis TaxID=8364 RepID=A0A8J0QYD1_XENTR|nr:interferon alpha/beta receptor 1 isoform X1 [Xenopus tropicalis]
MAAEPGLLLGAVLCILPLLPFGTGALLTGLTYPEPPFNVTVDMLPDRYSVMWDWNSVNWGDTKNVTFSVLLRKLKKKTQWNSVPGCLHIPHRNCSIDPALVDIDKRYQVRVRAEIAQINFSFSDTITFTPKAPGEIALPIAVYVESIDGGVKIKITLPNTREYWDNALFDYILLLRTNSSIEERRSLYPNFYLYDLNPGENYCFKVKVSSYLTKTNDTFSPEKCFKVEAVGLDGRPYPENVTMEALNTNYMLKWDWDYSQHPNVTFSVENNSEIWPGKWNQVQGCENISRRNCDVSGIYIYGKYNFRVAASLDNNNRTLSRALRFNPEKDTVIGPPSNVSTELYGTKLHVNVLKVEAFHNDDLKNYCDWEYNLIYWKDSASDREEKTLNEKVGRFTIEVEASTTYCLTVRVVCQTHNRSGLFSETQCITTGADALPVWSAGIVIGVLLSVVLTAVLVYLCACPLKRYVKHIFYPTGKLPSSIESGMFDSRVKIPFVLQEEEPTDLCYIIRNSEHDEDSVQNRKYSLKESNTDSGNYSNEDETTGDNGLSIQRM